MALFNVIHGDRIPTSAFNVKVPVWRIPRWVVLVWLTIKGLGLLIALLFKWWRITLPTAVALYVYFGYGRWWLIGPAVGLAIALTAWGVLHRNSFERFAWWPLLARWRRFVLRRKWYAAMSNTGLATAFDGHRFIPILKRVRCGYGVDRLTVKIVTGQMPDDFAKAGMRLAYAFGVRSVKAHQGRKPHLVELVMRRGDLLLRTIAPLPVPLVLDLAALPVAVEEDGDLYSLRLLGTQLLVVGATGAGKGSVIWAVLRSLASGVAAGTVRVWGLDPKHGMELYTGKPLFDKLVSDSVEEMADLLEEAVKTMLARAGTLRGRTRQHTPSVDEPLYLIVIDELASLTAYLNNKALKDRIKNALGLLLTTGRAVGVHVMACLQDPRKEVLPLRDLFPTRIGLRMTEEAHVDLVLGDGMRERGALCDRIPQTLPGVGYIVRQGDPTPVRVRFPYATDDDIREMAATYQPRRVIDGEVVTPRHIQVGAQ